MASAEFVRDAVIAGRYRIVRLLGEGGMGAVYEAHDLEFDEPVALKTILPGVARDAKALERFKREIQIARKVTHPNICRIFDVGYHAPAGEGAERIAFVTMELLRGESLSDRIRRRGRLAAAEALPLVRQLVEGLSAAHSIGVVHRDFKSPNVLLVRREGSGGERAVITDFGLALMLAGDSPAPASLTVSGTILGTPAYMAPEQIEGSRVTAAADTYALGCVMFEMLTGRLPFTGDSPLSIAFKRLTEPAPAPRTLVPDLDPRWDEVILRCLERKPENRFVRVEDVARALNGERLETRPSPDAPTIPLERGDPQPERKPRRLVDLALLLLAAAIVAGTFLWNRRAGDAPVGPVRVAKAGVSARPSVAVLEFRNATGRNESSWIGTATQSFVMLALDDPRKLRVVRAEETARALTDLRIAPTDRLSRDSLQALGRYLNADYVVLGSFAPSNGGRLTFTAQAQEARSGASVASSRAEAEAGQLDVPGRVIADAIRQALKLPASDPAQANADAVFPRQPAARQSYFEALGTLRLLDSDDARRLAAAAVRADPGFAPAHFVLAESCAALGYDAQAQQEAKLALDRAHYAPPAERLWMQARYFELTRQWSRAAETWSQLAGGWPDELEYGLRLANAYRELGDGKAALGALAPLRRIRGPIASDPRIDLAEARAAEPLGDYAMKERAAIRAAVLAEQKNSRRDLAEARYLEGMAAHGTGDFKRAQERYSVARSLFEVLGDRDRAALVTRDLARLLADQGDTAAAAAKLGEALAIAEATGNRRDFADTLNDMGNAAFNAHDFALARERWNRAWTTQREVGDRLGEGITINNLGNLEIVLGDLSEARRRFEQALSIGREVGDTWGTATSLANLIDALHSLGDVRRATSMCEEAIALFRKIGDRQALAKALEDSATLLLEQGRLAEAGTALDEAFTVARSNADRAGLGRMQATMARLRIERGDLSEAARSVEESLAIAQETGDPALRSRANAVAGDLRRLRGDLEGAGTALAQALRDDEALGNSLRAARNRVALAQLALDRGDLPQALRLASSARDVFRRQQAKGDEAFSELALIRFYCRQRNPVLARSSLQTLTSLTGTGDAPVPLMLRARAAAALVGALSGNTTDGARTLSLVAAEAKKGGLMRVYYETLIDSAALLEGAGRSRDAAAVASTIQRELVPRGFAARHIQN